MLKGKTLNFLRAIFLTSQGVLPATVLLALTHVLVARLLEPENVGPVNLARRIFAYIQAVGTAGLYQAVVYYAAPARGEQRRDLVRASVWLCLCLAGPTALVLLVAGDPILTHLFGAQMAGFGPPIGILVLCGCLVPIYEGYLTSAKAFKGLRDFRLLFGGLAISVGVTPLWVVGRTPTVAIWSWAATYTLLVAYILTRHASAVPKLFSPLHRERCVPMLIYGLPRACSQLVARLASSIDVPIITSMVGASAFGLYSTAKGVVLMLPVLVEPLALASFPYFRDMVTGKETARLERTVSQIVAVVVLTYLFVGATLVACGQDIVALVWGESYIGMTASLQICAVGLLGTSIYSALRHLVNSLSVRPINLCSFTIALVVNAGLTCLLVPCHGIEGAAVASSLASLVLATLTLGYIRYKGIRVLDTGQLGWLALALAGFAGLALLVKAAPFPFLWKSVAVGLPGAVWYLVLVRTTAPPTWHRARSALTRFRRRDARKQDRK